MNILYHITNLPPKMPGTEAILQEIAMLRHHFGGDLLHVNPNIRSRIYLPRLLFGFHKLKQIYALEAGVDLHHFYNADPYPFPVTNFFKRPVIYSVSSGVGTRRPPVGYFNSLAAVTVSDERSLARLERWGIKNCHLVRPGLNLTGFEYEPLPLGAEIRLLFASAPWSMAQFKSKGVDALLDAARLMPELRLIFLWRGVLFDEMLDRLRRLGLEHQVKIINKKVDINKLLAQVHGTVNLATKPEIIRSYPHSLIESLAAGKPVIVSRTIPMSDYVVQTDCGEVVEEVTPVEIVRAVRQLVENYQKRQLAALAVGQHDFSQEAAIASFQQIYEHVLDAPHA